MGSGNHPCWRNRNLLSKIFLQNKFHILSWRLNRKFFVKIIYLITAIILIIRLPGGGIGNPWNAMASSNILASWHDPSYPANMYVNFMSNEHATNIFCEWNPLWLIQPSAFSRLGTHGTCVPSIAPMQPCMPQKTEINQRLDPIIFSDLEPI